eukprot:935461-Rhodomonas_salina.1
MGLSGPRGREIGGRRSTEAREWRRERGSGSGRERGSRGRGPGEAHLLRPVSYTHLTLPTICSV